MVYCEGCYGVCSTMGVGCFFKRCAGVPRSVVPINAMVAVLAVGGSRMFARWLLRKIEDSVL